MRALPLRMPSAEVILASSLHGAALTGPCNEPALQNTWLPCIKCFICVFCAVRLRSLAEMPTYVPMPADSGPVLLRASAHSWASTNIAATLGSVVSGLQKGAKQESWWAAKLAAALCEVCSPVPRLPHHCIVQLLVVRNGAAGCRLGYWPYLFCHSVPCCLRAANILSHSVQCCV